MSILGKIIQMPTPSFDKNGKAEARFFELPFKCRGKTKTKVVRRSPRKHLGSSLPCLPRKRSVLGVGKLTTLIAGMPRSHDAWCSVQLMLYDLQWPGAIAPLGKLLLPDKLGHILSFTDFSVENACTALCCAQMTSEISMDLVLCNMLLNAQSFARTCVIWPAVTGMASRRRIEPIGKYAVLWKMC